MGKKAVSKLFYHLSILSTFLLAGITLAGAFSGQLSPAGHIRFAFIGLALPVLLLINFAALIYWAIRLRVWLLIPLIAILGNWGYLSRVIRFSSPPPSLAAFTIATYNVDAFNGDQTGYSCKEIARYMEEQHADILCMQEFGSNREFNVDRCEKSLFHMALLLYSPSSRRNTDPATRRIQQVSHTQPATHHIPRQ